MEIAIVSDTHMPRGARVVPGACLDRMRAVDLILHAGDFTAMSMLDELSALGPLVHAVHGNMDSFDLQALLPDHALVKVGEARIGLVHDPGPAVGRLERLRRMFPDADAAVFGHTHMPQHEASADGAFQIFNPGSPTDRRRAPAHTMGIARISDGRVEFELVVVEH